MLVFLGLMIAGVLFFAVSLLFGDAEHGDVSHEGFDQATLDHVDTVHDTADEHEGQGPSIFSIRSFFLFLTGFGAAGAIGKYFGFSNFISSGLGSLAGIVFAVIGYSLYRAVYHQQASTTTNTASLAGQTARVTVTISPNEVGQVVTRSQYGTTLYLRAQSQNETIPEGTTVKIQNAIGDLVTVVPVS